MSMRRVRLLAAAVILLGFGWSDAFAAFPPQHSDSWEQGACWRLMTDLTTNSRFDHGDADHAYTDEASCEAAGSNRVWAWIGFFENAGGFSQEELDQAYADGYAAAAAELFTQEDLDAAYAEGLAADAVAISGSGIPDLTLEETAQLTAAVLLLFATAYGVRVLRKSSLIN